MPTRIFTHDPFKVFYTVFAYIIIFSIWWGYLLYNKNEVAFRETIELNERQYKQQFNGANYKATDEYVQLLTKYNRQRVMIFAEGSVFLVLQFIGLVLVRRVFMREIEMAAQQRNFLLSITHELKSPLSSIKLTLQTMMKRKLEPAQSEKLMTNSLSDVDRLEALVDNILFAAKIERDETGFSNDELNVSALVERIAEKLSSNKKGVKIVAEAEPDVTMHADTMGFSSVVLNLIENAIKYSDEGTTVRVTLKREGEKVRLCVYDEGYGIPVEEREKVFGKFYRIGNEDTRKSKGTGLGLYIVKRFVEIYNGSITIEDNKPRGSVFRLEFMQA
jgi:two-component system, OmpR family, phosphate regulon sensor histidine kinase PhoR